MDPQSHAILVNALATLNHKPSAMWMSAAEESSLLTLGSQQSAAGLSQLLYGFAMLGHRPRQVGGSYCKTSSQDVALALQDS